MLLPPPLLPLPLPPLSPHQEFLERQTEQLHQSVQRAQEEAAKDKHQQRIKELARKGHDVSNRLRSLEGPPTASQSTKLTHPGSFATVHTKADFDGFASFVLPALPTRESPSPRQQEPAGWREEAVSTASPRRDMAVQTGKRKSSTVSGKKTFHENIPFCVC